MHKLAIKRNEPSLESDLLFHNALVEASNNFVMAKVYESISDLLTSIRKELLDFENKEKSLHYHQQILEAVVNQQEDEARHWMRAHLLDVSESYHRIISKR